MELIGDWQGTLDRLDVTAEEHVALFLTGKSRGLRLVFHITKTKDGYASMIDSLDQGAKEIPTETTVLDGNNLLITSPIIGAEFRATILGDKIIGTWSQYGDEFPELTLNRMVAKNHEPKNLEQKNQEPMPIVGDWEGKLQSEELSTVTRIVNFLMGKT